MRRSPLFLIATITLLSLSACGGSAEPTASSTATTGSKLERRVGQPKKQQPLLIARQTGSLPAPVQLPGVAVTGAGSLLAIGGLDSADSSVSAIVSVTGASARNAGSLPSAFHDAAASAIGSTAFVFGGGEGGATRAQILRISNGSTSEVGQLPSGSSDSEAATIAGTIYIVGGYDGSNGLSTIVGYRPGSAARVVAHLPVALRYASVAAVGGKLMIAGGSSNSVAQREILAFDPNSQQVSKLGILPYAVTHAAGASLNGIFYVIG
ncbi:MAG: hypothetical protein WCL20_09360, partial [Actinomycetes bacterium]